MNKSGLVPVSLVLLLLAAGCSSRPGGSVYGKVTYHDAPVPGGIVLFVPAEGPAYKASITADGTYSTTDVPPGEYTVTVDTEFLNPNKVVPQYGGARAQGADMEKNGKKPSGPGGIEPRADDFKPAEGALR